jgi:tetratricopeptide (TPR) repeat protein
MSPEAKQSPQADNILERQGELETVFLNSIREAEKSGIPTTIAHAKDEYGRWLMSTLQRRYNEAVPYFKGAAKIQEAEFNMGEAAQAYHMLSSCLFLIGGVDDLKEAEGVIKKAVELYPNSEEFRLSKQSALIQHIVILSSLTNQTGDIDYFIQGQRICKKYEKTLNEGKAVKDQLVSIGFMKN